MVPVGEVKAGQDGLEIVEYLTVSGHVSGQNTSAGRRDEIKEALVERGRGRGSGRGSGTGRAERFRRTSSLDDSFPDAFVLICRQISEDVALSLQNREGFVGSGQWRIVDAKTTDGTVNHTQYFLHAGVFYYSRSVSRPWPQSHTSARTKGQNKLLYLCVLYKNCVFHATLPSRVFQMPLRSGGSPGGRCHCSGVRVQSEHLSAESRASVHSVTVCDKSNLDGLG